VQRALPLIALTRQAGAIAAENVAAA